MLYIISLIGIIYGMNCCSINHLVENVEPKSQEVVDQLKNQEGEQITIDKLLSLLSKKEKNSYRKTESGLIIVDKVNGKGDEATAGKMVTVHYTLKLKKYGKIKIIDTSIGRAPFSFTLGAGTIIKGFDEGVAGMKVGGKRKLIIPPKLGYGSREVGNVIPAYAILIFEVELLKVN